MVAILVRGAVFVSNQMVALARSAFAPARRIAVLGVLLAVSSASLLRVASARRSEHLLQAGVLLAVLLAALILNRAIGALGNRRRLASEAVQRRIEERAPMTDALAQPEWNRLRVHLRTRAMEAQSRANWAMTLILVAIGTGLVLFLFAGEIAQRESYFGSALSRVDYDIAKINDRLERDGGKVDALKEIADIRRVLSELNNGVQREQLTAATAIATRAGTVLLLIFLTQILVQLVRYHQRTAAFYNGRADALMLADVGKELSIKDAEAFLAGDRLDFGKPPKSAYDEAIAIVKDVFATTAKK